MNPDSKVTKHQLKILECLACGMTQIHVARELHISVDTVSYHLKNVRKILRAKTSAEAIAKAMKAGLLDIDSSQEAGTEID